MHTTTASLSEKIASYDFSKVVAHAIKENPAIITQATSALEEYKKFILLNAICQEKVAVPSPEVDQLWHSHILHTREYAEFCQSLQVPFMHHSPHSDEITQQERDGLIENLVKCSARVFGENVFTIKPAHSSPDW